MTVDVYISREVEQVAALYAGLIGDQAWRRTARDQIAMLAERLLDGHRTQHPGVVFELRCWLPDTVNRAAADLFAQPLTLEDARHTVACAHGFGGWPSVTETAADPLFEQAVETVLSGNTGALDALLSGSGYLAAARSHYGHRATLLHYVAANGVESYRQRVPATAPDITRLLLDHGADADATMPVYGANYTMRDLLLSSAHPARAGVVEPICAILDGSAV